MTDCPFASDPVKCLNEHNSRLLAVRFGEAIECAQCPYARPNAIVAFEPEPGWGPYCVQCGGPLYVGKYGYVKSSTGLCRECSSRRKTNKGNQSKRKGVKAYWGYKAMTTKIIEYEQAKREATCDAPSASATAR